MCVRMGLCGVFVRVCILCGCVWLCGVVCCAELTWQRLQHEGVWDGHGSVRWRSAEFASVVLCCAVLACAVLLMLLLLLLKAACCLAIVACARSV